MAEKGHQQLHAQSAPANMDIESSAAPAQYEDLRSRPRRSRTKIIVFIVLLIVIHSIIIVTLDLTIFRIRTPKYRLKSVTMDNLVVSTSTNSPSFRMKLDADVTIKNKNFGPYKYHDCYMTLSYRGKRVGEAFIKEAGAKALSTKVLKVSLNVTYSAGSDGSSLRNDISSGSLGLSSKSEMRGQVEVLKVLKRDNKYPKMDCSITIDLAEKVVRDLKCM